MTFTYAVIAESGIVLAADSQMTYTHRNLNGDVVGTYESFSGKIRRIGNNRFAFSIAGNRGMADTLLAKAELRQIDQSGSFEELVQEYRNVFSEEWYNKYSQLGPRVDAAFLFCGFLKGRVPQIVKLDSTGNFIYNPITSRGFAWTGATEHGAALYLHHRFYRAEQLLTLEQAKLLTYCAAKEIADQDNTVGGPIEVEVITPNGSTPMTAGDIDKYERARQEIASRVITYLEEFK